MMRKLLLTGLLSAAALGAMAQLNSSVSVEGEYLPLIIETERLNSFPLGYRFELPGADIDYEFKGVVTDFRPSLLTMGATGRQTDWPWSESRGFLDLSLGSWLDSRLHGGYYILSDSVNSLLADLKFRSTSLYRAKGVPAGWSEPARRKLHDGTLGLHYTRLLGEEGMLKAEAAYRLGYFNYYGTSLPAPLQPHVPSQTVNGIDVTAGYSSSPSTVKGWHAEADFRFMSYRRLYGPVASGRSGKGDRESHLKAGAGYAFNFADFNAIAIDVEGDFLFFPRRSPSALGITDYSRRNYGSVALRPSYRLENGALGIRAGVDVAATYDAMGPSSGKDFGTVHLAPDVMIGYRSQAGVGVSLTATGGVIPSTLYTGEEFDLYRMPWQLSTCPVYSPVDARLTLSTGPFAGFSGSVALRYAVARNVPTGGWYQVFLGTWDSSRYNLDNSYYTDPYSQTSDLHGLSVELGLNYALGTMVELDFRGSYTPQNGEEGIFNGFDRPRWTMEAKAAVRPISKLKIEAGYDYRGVRNCYAWTSSSAGKQLTASRLTDITDLKARITYSILDNLDIYCSGENLLNRHVDLLPGLQSEGLAVSGGFYIIF